MFAPRVQAVAVEIAVGMKRSKALALELLGVGGVELATRLSVTMQIPEPPTWIRAACPHRRQPGYVLPAVTSTLCTASRGGSARLHCKTPSCEPESAQVFISSLDRLQSVFAVVSTSQANNALLSFSDLPEQTGMAYCRS